MEFPKEAVRHFAIQNEVETQTDRGAALIAVAYLDERLREALRSAFSDAIEQVKDGGDTVESRLFEGTGPLATLSARINMCLALGFLGPVAHRELHLIRKIRNRFAHSADATGFAQQPVADWSRELQLPEWCHEGPEVPAPVEPRARFLRSVHLLWAFLWTEMCKRGLVGAGRAAPAPQVLI